MDSTKCRPQTKNRVQKAVCKAQTHQLQSRTKLLEKVFPIMSTFLRNKTISEMTSLWKKIPLRQINVASYKCPGIRLSFEYITTLLSGEGGDGRTGAATMFRKMLPQYTVFSAFLSKVVGTKCRLWQKKFQTTLSTSTVRMQGFKQAKIKCHACNQQKRERDWYSVGPNDFWYSVVVY